MWKYPESTKIFQYRGMDFDGFRVVRVKRLFHIGVWTFAWFVRPLLSLSHHTLYIGYTMYHVIWQKKNDGRKKKRKKQRVTAPILKPTDDQKPKTFLLALARIAHALITEIIIKLSTWTWKVHVHVCTCIAFANCACTWTALVHDISVLFHYICVYINVSS